MVSTPHAPGRPDSPARHKRTPEKAQATSSHDRARPRLPTDAPELTGSCTKAFYGCLQKESRHPRIFNDPQQSYNVSESLYRRSESARSVGRVFFDRAFRMILLAVAKTPSWRSLAWSSGMVRWSYAYAGPSCTMPSEPRAEDSKNGAASRVRCTPLLSRPTLSGWRRSPPECLCTILGGRTSR
jgi:hypothetical protein